MAREFASRTTLSISPATTNNKKLRPLLAISRRSLDFVLAIMALICVTPLMVLLAILIKVDSDGSILFRQKRFGLDASKFQILKFRTMHTHSEAPSGALQAGHDSLHLTRVGGWLRRTRLDELPQLLNVVRGDMAIVGPRPHPICMTVAGKLYHDAFPDYHLRHQVRPGITGLAQVNGFFGSVETLEDAASRLTYDLSYVERRSLVLDAIIILRTFSLPLARMSGNRSDRTLLVNACGAIGRHFARRRCREPHCSRAQRRVSAG